MKNRIRLTEGQLHRVIKESICNVLNEGYNSDDLIESLADRIKKILCMKYLGLDVSSETEKLFNDVHLFKLTTVIPDDVFGIAYGQLNNSIRNSCEDLLSQVTDRLSRIDS